MKYAPNLINTVYVLEKRRSLECEFLSIGTNTTYLHDVVLANHGPVLVIAAISVTKSPKCRPVAGCCFASDVWHLDSRRYAHLAASLGLKVGALSLDTSLIMKLAKERVV